MAIITKPFFLLGTPRSGTTLLRLMLNTHPKITVPPECGFALWLYNKYGGIHDFTPTMISLYLEDLVECKKFETWNIPLPELSNIFSGMSIGNYQELVAQIYLTYGKIRGKDSLVVGDKNNYYINEMATLKMAFPDSKIIHLVRDGRDVACSYLALLTLDSRSKYRPSLSNDLENIALQWAKQNCEASNIFHENLYLIRYEDLIERPAFELSKICDFLGVRFSRKMLEYYKVNDEPNEFMPWKRGTLNPVYGSSIGRFRCELSEAQRALYENIAGTTLRLFKYDV